MRVRRWVELAAVGLVATALTWIVFRPSPGEIVATLPAHRGAYADAVLLTWAIGHVSQSLFGLAAPLFDAPIFHPARNALAFGDHMIGQAALGLPVWWLTGNPVLEYNLLALASYPAAALGAFAYLRHGVGLPALAALAGGLALAFTPYRFHSPLWLQVLWVAFVPLALLGWLRFVRTGGAGAWIAWVGCWAFHSLLGLYLALYFGIVMTALAAWTLVAAPRRRERRVRAGTLAAPLAMLVLVSPTLLPYAALRAQQGNVRHAGLDTTWTFLLPSPDTTGARLLDLGPAVGWFGPGLVVWALATVGIAVGIAALARRPALSSEQRFIAGAHLLALAITMVLLLAPAELQQRVPGLDMVRVTNRVFFVALVFTAAFVGAGVAWCGGRIGSPRLRAGVMLALLTAVVADMGPAPRERKPIDVPPELPPAIAFLASQPRETAVYEHVFGPDQLAVSMYHGLFHRHPIPTGWSGFFPPGASFANVTLYEFPSAAAVETLRRLDVGWVWKHFRRVEDGEAFGRRLPPGARVAERFGTDVVFDLREVTAQPPPDVDDAEPVSRALWDAVEPELASSIDELRDGDPTTLWTYPAIDPFTPASYAINLGQPCDVAVVRVRVPRGLGDAIAAARVEVSDDGQTWAPFATFLPRPFEPFFTRPPEILTLEARDVPATARFLRLVATGAALWAGPWRIGELEVLATPR